MEINIPHYTHQIDEYQIKFYETSLLSKVR